MSLLRLLTTGKSLVGLKKLDHRYHLPGEKAIPQFGPKKNPFRATVFPEKPEPAATPTEPAAQPADAVAAVEAPRSTPTQASNPDPGPPSAAAGLNSDCPQASSGSKQSRPSALRALLLWGRARKSSSAGPAKGRPLVQTELSLDSIKVVRNDLSESDLEIVPLEKKQKAAPMAPIEPALEFAADSRSPGMRQICGANNM